MLNPLRSVPMKSGNREVGASFWKLKLQYQFLLIWLPVLGFLLGTVGGMYLTGVALAQSLGINIQESIASQPNGGRFFWSIMCAGVLAGAALAALTYCAALFGLAAQVRQTWRGLWHSLRAEDYPSAWQ
jgi:hypothetical protein